jgi:hypothetical protein
MRWRTLNVALVCEPSMVQVVVRAAVVPSVLLVVCMVVSSWSDAPAIACCGYLTDAKMRLRVAVE